MEVVIPVLLRATEDRPFLCATSLSTTMSFGETYAPAPRIGQDRSVINFVNKE